MLTCGCAFVCCMPTYAGEDAGYAWANEEDAVSHAAEGVDGCEMCEVEGASLSRERDVTDTATAQGKKKLPAGIGGSSADACNAKRSSRASSISRSTADSVSCCMHADAAAQSCQNYSSENRQTCSSENRQDCSSDEDVVDLT